MVLSKDQIIMYKGNIYRILSTDVYYDKVILCENLLTKAHLNISTSEDVEVISELELLKNFM